MHHDPTTGEWVCGECGAGYACESAADTCEQIDNGTAYQHDD